MTEATPNPRSVRVGTLVQLQRSGSWRPYCVQCRPGISGAAVVARKVPSTGGWPASFTVRAEVTHVDVRASRCAVCDRTWRQVFDALER